MAEEDETIQKLPDDVIIEIITRLPLKSAARCRILNKYMYNNMISIPKLLSSIKPIILRDTFGDRITIISSPLRTAALPSQIWIIDSCNGIVFLRCNRSQEYYLFNPLTGGILLVDHDMDHSTFRNINNCKGLAVNITAKPFDFKLVDLQIENFSNPVQSRLRFSVYHHVPLCKSRNFVKKYLYFDYRGSFTTLYIEHQRPVYAHGCLHWLGDCCTAIAALDMESERRRIIGGPLVTIYEGGPGPNYRPWFGLAQGSLQFIRIDRISNTIIVHSHNYATEEWRVAHKIEIPNYMRGNRRMVEFFDGRNVFCKIIVRKVDEIYVHDLSNSEWNKVGQVEVHYVRHCMEFVPTMARVSGVHLSLSELSPELRLTLLRLQQILLGGS